jgi:hypothetical protein
LKSAFARFYHAFLFLLDAWRNLCPNRQYRHSVLRPKGFRPFRERSVSWSSIRHAGNFCKPDLPYP